MRKTLRSTLVALVGMAMSTTALAQFEPPAGQPGSHAIHADSSVFIAWGATCIVTRSWVDMSDTTLGLVTHGSDSAALGKADNDVVSLGDGGSAVITFDNPIVDGPGYDFAVFENAFADAYLELGFVEVSSDGIHFFRFPAVSLTDTSTQVTGFDTLDATKIDMLAGKYRAFYGMPFDLADMVFQTGLDVNNVTHVRIVDVVGSLDPAYATYDIQGRPVNDPFPTPWSSSGFDLDAVGVINNTLNVGISEVKNPRQLRVWPNPATDRFLIEGNHGAGMVILSDLAGHRQELSILPDGSVDIRGLAPGFYTGSVILDEGMSASFRLIKH